MFDRQILDKVEQELRRQYYSRGKYGLKITSEVKDLPRNRVAIEIKISEGRVAKIKQINIVGNNKFSDKELLQEFELSTGNLLSFYTKDDQYSKQKLSADLKGSGPSTSTGVTSISRSNLPRYPSPRTRRKSTSPSTSRKAMCTR